MPILFRPQKWFHVSVIPNEGVVFISLAEKWIVLQELIYARRLRPLRSERNRVITLIGGLHNEFWFEFEGGLSCSYKFACISLNGVLQLVRVAKIKTVM